MEKFYILKLEVPYLGLKMQTTTSFDSPKKAISAYRYLQTCFGINISVVERKGKFSRKISIEDLLNKKS